jgi:hypothetical protein
VEGRFYLHKLVAMLGTVIFSDYFSTFLVRASLVVAGDRPLVSTALATISGSLVVTIFYVIGFLGPADISPGSGHINWLASWNYYFVLHYTITNPSAFSYMTPALWFTFGSRCFLWQD